MKKIITILLMIAFAFSAKSQSAQLDKLRVNSRFQVPFYSTLPGSGLTREMVFDYNGPDSGLYFRSYDGTRWIKFPVNGGNAGWGLTGNAGTNPATDFIGTTDNQDFVIKRNNIEIARFRSNGLFFGSSTGYATSSNFIGVNAGRYTTDSYSSNFIGSGSGDGSSNSFRSNFLGQDAGRNATNVSYSNLFGYNVGTYFTGHNIGANNIIIGTNISLPNTTANAINLGGVIFATGSYSTTTGDPSIVPAINARVGIGIVTPNTSSILDLNSTNKGFLPPRMTSAERIAISAPATALRVYDSDSARDMVNTPSGWKGVRYTSDPIPALSIDTITSTLGANVTLTVASTWYDIGSVTLPSGTWILMGQASYTGGAINGLRIHDGTTTFSSNNILTPNIGSRESSLSVYRIVAPTTTTTYKLQGASTTAGALVNTTITINTLGNATHFSAVKIK